MTNLSSLAITDAELDRMAHSLAFDASVSAIDSACAKVDALDGEWFDITPANVYHIAQPFVADAVIYLEARGLLERHDDNPNWVALNNESEATR
jgi:hypothetical protein